MAVASHADAGRWPAAAIRSRLLDVLAGGHAGPPPYVTALADGVDEGYFPMGGAAWTVHCDIATLVAGPRALLMQALHPGAMAGVHDWSRYREDPFGRLNGTIRWITVTTYGDTAQARAASAMVGRLHERVRGEYTDAAGAAVAYSASDADLLSWVHLAFADSFLRTHELFGRVPIPGGPDAYVREWAVAGELMGVADPPRSAAELDAHLASIRASGVLRSDARVMDAVRFLRRPPLPKLLRPTYPPIFAGAVAALPLYARELLGLRDPGPLGRAMTRAVLASTKALLGQAAAETTARARNERLRSSAGSAAGG